MKYLVPGLLLIEAGMSFYKYLFPRGYWGSSITDIIGGMIFLGLAVWQYKKPNERAAQWLVIILSILFGPGGFLGFGGIFAILLAMGFVLSSRNNKKLS